MKTTYFMLAAALCAAGCIHVKTENEVKPIHITMDVNVKLDKALDSKFQDEKKPQPGGDFAKIKDMLDRKVAGIDTQGRLAARDGATDDEKLAIFDANSRYDRRIKEVASETGVSEETVKARRATQMVERIPAGSGIWYQDAGGDWKQK